MSQEQQIEFWDWTVGPHNKSNTSQVFNVLVADIKRIIRNDAATLIARRADATARIIAAQIAHVHHFVPSKTAKEIARGALSS